LHAHLFDVVILSTRFARASVSPPVICNTSHSSASRRAGPGHFSGIPENCIAPSAENTEQFHGDSAEVRRVPAGHIGARVENIEQFPATSPEVRRGHRKAASAWRAGHIASGFENTWQFLATSPQLRRGHPTRPYCGDLGAENSAPDFRALGSSLRSSCFGRPRFNLRTAGGLARVGVLDEKRMIDGACASVRELAFRRRFCNHRCGSMRSALANAP